MEEPLVVVDEERRALLLAEGREPHPFAPLPAQLHRAPDHVRQPQAALQLVKEARIVAHILIYHDVRVVFTPAHLRQAN